MFRCHLIYGYPVFQFRHTRIRFCENRDRGISLHVRKKLCHLLRTGGTVQTHGIRTQSLKDHDCDLRGGPEQGLSVLAEGKAYHDRDLLTQFTDGDQRGS